MAPPKAPKRFTGQMEKLPEIPGGFYDNGIRDSEITQQLGFAITLWSHIEDLMIRVFSDLVSDSPVNSARQIFRSIPNNANRIKVMKAMLERSPQNVARGPFYDEAIGEFEQLNIVRNDYVHGLWKTNINTKKVYLMQPTPDELGFREAKEVSRKEIGRFVARLISLNNKIKMREYHDRMKRSKQYSDEPRIGSLK